MATLALLALATGCGEATIDQLDGPFYDGDHRLVHCGVNLDTSANATDASIDRGLDRAAARGETLELYTHDPGTSVPIARIERVLAGARERGLRFVTYADFAHDTAVGPGLALSFDDTFVDAWTALRPLFASSGARVTFFVSRFAELDPAQVAELHQLAADGHDIEAHSISHQNAPDYVEAHGLQPYLDDELDPSIAILRAEGFEVPAFAYPFGARTAELDAAIGRRVSVIRSVDYTYSVIQSPCPR